MARSPKPNNKVVRKLTRRSPRTRILEELDAIKAMVGKHCMTNARQPIKVVAPPAAIAPAAVAAAPAEEFETISFPKAPVEEKVLIPVGKKSASCPGGPKAFNEFIKQYRESHPEKNYQSALKEGAQEWYAKCGIPAPVKKNRTNKNKKNLGGLTSSKPKTPGVRKTAVKKVIKGGPTGFAQAAPLVNQGKVYNPFNDFNAALPPPPPKSANVNANAQKIGNWKLLRRNANTELNVLQNSKGQKIFKTSNNGVFRVEVDANDNETIGEWMGVMRPDGTINTDMEAPA